MDDLSQCRPAVQALVARVLRRRKDDPDVEDCTHETLRRALERKHELPVGRALLPWMLGVARHVALDALRTHYRTDRRWITAAEDPSLALEGQPDPGGGPERRASVQQEARRLQDALIELPEGQRIAIEMFHLDQLGYKEIAERLGVPVATVGTWMLRARQHLALALADPDFERSVLRRTRETQ